MNDFLNITLNWNTGIGFWIIKHKYQFVLSFNFCLNFVNNYLFNISYG